MIALQLVQCRYGIINRPSSLVVQKQLALSVGSLRTQPSTPVHRRQHGRQQLGGSRRPPLCGATASGSSQGDARAGREPELSGALDRVGDRFADAAQQLKSTFNGSSCTASKDTVHSSHQADGDQQRRQQQAGSGDLGSDLASFAETAAEAGRAGLEAGLSRGQQDLAKTVQLANKHRHTAADMLSRSNSGGGAVRNVRTQASKGADGSLSANGLIPSVFGRWRSRKDSIGNGNGSGSGSSEADGSEAGQGRGSDVADSFIVKAQQGATKVASVLATSASQGGGSLLDATGAGVSAAGSRLQQAANRLPSSGGKDGAGGRGAGSDEENVGMAAGAQRTLDRVEQHRLPAALLAALLAGCLKPEWGASVPAGGPWVQAALLALVFFLYGLNFGRTALFAGDALYAWGSLALQHANNWRHRYIWPRSELKSTARELKLQSKTSVLVLQGVEARRGEAAKALLSWPAAVWAAASSLLVAPLAAVSVPLLPMGGAAPGLALGLAAWYCVPTTLSRSIALTEVPLLVGPLLAPLLPPDVSMPAPAVVLVALLRLCVLPLGAGVAARRCFPTVAREVDAHSRPLSYAGTAALAGVAWLAISRGLAAPAAAPVAPTMLAVISAAAAAAHAAFLGLNTFVVHRWRLGGNDAPESYLYEGSAFDEDAHQAQALAVERAAVIVASQKTLPAALALVGLFCTSSGGGAGGVALWLATGGGSAGGGAALCGAATAAAVAAHLAQTAVDSLSGWAWLNFDPLAAETAARTRKAARKAGFGGDDSALTTA